VSWELVYEHEIEGNVDLYLLAAGEGVPRRLTVDPGEDSLARWMPDGERIVFTSNRSGTAQLWEISAVGGPPRRIRRNDAQESQADPSPDGRMLAFLSDLEGPPRLLVMDLSTRAVTELVRHGRETMFGNPHWSPDGSQVTFSSDWRTGHQVWVVDVATRGSRKVSNPAAGACEPRFTRDGRAVAYVSRGSEPVSRLVERDLRTLEERVLVDWPAFSYDLAYSPDGSEIAFASNITGEWVIYRQRLADGRAWRVTFGGGPARYPDYRPGRSRGGS
jgi:Tol biopolymer transport system component